MEEVSKSASSRQDIATLREELQTLAKQSPQHAQPLEPVTKCALTSDSPQVASTSPEMQQMHEWLSKLQEEVKALTSDPQRVNELCPGIVECVVECVHEARTRRLHFTMSRAH